jgi:hypothetical protein
MMTAKGMDITLTSRQFNMVPDDLLRSLLQTGHSIKTVDKKKATIGRVAEVRRDMKKGGAK